MNRAHLTNSKIKIRYIWNYIDSIKFCDVVLKVWHNKWDCRGFILLLRIFRRLFISERNQQISTKIVKITKNTSKTYQPTNICLKYDSQSVKIYFVLYLVRVSDWPCFYTSGRFDWFKCENFAQSSNWKKVTNNTWLEVLPRWAVDNASTQPAALHPPPATASFVFVFVFILGQGVSTSCKNIFCFYFGVSTSCKAIF